MLLPLDLTNLAREVILKSISFLHIGSIGSVYAFKSLFGVSIYFLELSNDFLFFFYFVFNEV
jgi:hypothetical protein